MGRVWEGLKNCSTCATLAISHAAKRSKYLMSKQEFFKRLRDLLYHSRYQIVPPGDTIERPSIAQSVTMGAIPVYWGRHCNQMQHLPWSDVLNWNAFSVNFSH